MTDGLMVTKINYPTWCVFEGINGHLGCQKQDIFADGTGVATEGCQVVNGSMTAAWEVERHIQLRILSEHPTEQNDQITMVTIHHNMECVVVQVAWHCRQVVH